MNDVINNSLVLPDDGPGDVYKFANILLENIKATFNEYGVSLPSRQYIDIGGQGDAPWDCEQLTVSWDGTVLGMPGNPVQELQRCTDPRTATFFTEIVRCKPGLKGRNGNAIPPNVEDLNKFSKEEMFDGELLYEASVRAATRSWGGKALISISSSTAQGDYQAVGALVSVVVGFSSDDLP